MHSMLDSWELVMVHSTLDLEVCKVGELLSRQLSSVLPLEAAVVEVSPQQEDPS